MLEDTKLVGCYAHKQLCLTRNPERSIGPSHRPSCKRNLYKYVNLCVCVYTHTHIHTYLPANTYAHTTDTVHRELFREGKAGCPFENQTNKGELEPRKDVLLLFQGRIHSSKIKTELEQHQACQRMPCLLYISDTLIRNFQTSGRNKGWPLVWCWTMCHSTHSCGLR